MVRSTIRVGINEGATARTDQLLAQAPWNLQNKLLKQALRAAAGVVADEAKAKAPRGETGNLKGSLARRASIKVIASAKLGLTTALVGPGRPVGNHGHLVEHGHEKWLWGEHINGSRVDPQPFLKPAADQTKSRQSAAIIKKLRADLKKLVT